MMKDIKIENVKSRKGRRIQYKTFLGVFLGENDTVEKMRKRTLTKLKSPSKRQNLNEKQSEKSDENQEEHWIKSAKNSLKVDDKTDIQNDQLLNDRVEEAVQQIIKEQFPNINGFQPTVFKQNLKHIKMSHDNMVQLYIEATANQDTGSPSPLLAAMRAL